MQNRAGPFAARYRIVDPVAWFRLGERRGDLIDALLYGALTTTLAARTVDHVLTAELEETRCNSACNSPPLKCAS